MNIVPLKIPKDINYFQWYYNEALEIPFCTSSAFRRMDKLYYRFKKSIHNGNSMTPEEVMTNPKYRMFRDQLMSHTFRPIKMESHAIMLGKVQHTILEKDTHEDDYYILPKHSFSGQQFKIINQLAKSGKLETELTELDKATAYSKHYNNDITRTINEPSSRAKAAKIVTDLLAMNECRRIYSAIQRAVKQNIEIIQIPANKIQEMYDNNTKIKYALSQFIDLEDAHFEHVTAAVIDGLPIKTMCDVFYETEDVIYNIDYKTTSMPGNYAVDYYKKGNYYQGALYSKVIEAVYNKPVITIIVEINWITGNFYIYNMVDADHSKNIMITEDSKLDILSADSNGIIPLKVISPTTSTSVVRNFDESLELYAKLHALHANHANGIFTD